MTHDSSSEPVTRKERRATYGNEGRNAVTRRPFSVADHIRNDWTPDELMQFLEGRAAGYNGLLRNYLCTAAHHLRVAGVTIDRQSEELAQYRAAYAVDEDEMKEILNAGTETVIKPQDLPKDAKVKRNDQPGRLSGGEREALKKFVAFVSTVAASHSTVASPEEVMAEGRALLKKVRTRALGDRAAFIMNKTIEGPDEGTITRGTKNVLADLGIEDAVALDEIAAQGGGA